MTMAQRVFENKKELDRFLLASVLMGVTPDKNETPEARQLRAATLSNDIRLYAVEYYHLVEDGVIEPHKEGTDNEKKKSRERLEKDVKKVLDFFQIKDEDLEPENDVED